MKFSKKFSCFLLLAYCISLVQCVQEEKLMHPKHQVRTKQSPPVEDANFWKTDAQDRLKKKLQIMPIEGVAKNVLFYLGDGMSIPTVTAARVMKGQKVDNLPFGEEAELYMDTFPFTGTSKTFCSDTQVADSACSATAYLCGSKGNEATIGVTPGVLRKSCEAQSDPANHVSSVLAWAQAEGKSTGIVTTTRVTHASPAGTYAHIADRDWENDNMIQNDGQDSQLCDDIAEQLILREPGRSINVILGGGRRQFLPSLTFDPEYPTVNGLRRDGKNLIEVWKESKNAATSKYVIGRDELLAVDALKIDHLLGLFEADHVRFLDEQQAHNDPSLEEMVQVAISILSKNPKGFFLFVEGGRIDHAHHGNLVKRALWETIEFDKAIKKGDELTNDNETLIVVTSDHAHVMQFAGYPDRGTPILSQGTELADDGLPYNTLLYGNGPGLWFNPLTFTRRNVSEEDTESELHFVPSPVLTEDETHGGDDVLIFAKGPFAHLLTGVHQQSYIPHVVGYSACIGSGNWSDHCGPRSEEDKDDGSSAILLLSQSWTICTFILFAISTQLFI